MGVIARRVSWLGRRGMLEGFTTHMMEFGCLHGASTSFGNGRLFCSDFMFQDQNDILSTET